MYFGHPRTITTFKNQNFFKIWVFQGFPYTRLGSNLAILSSFWGKNFQNPCKKWPSHGEKILKIFLFFHHFLRIFCHALKFFAQKWAQNGQIWAKSGVWETLKNPNFEKISVFEGCDASRMPKMYSREV